MSVVDNRGRGLGAIDGAAVLTTPSAELETWVDGSGSQRRRVSSWWVTHRPWFLPEGRGLSDEVWLKRHRGLTWFLWAQVPVLLIYGVLRGYGLVGARSNARC